jgi:hypothetical protein
MRQTDKKIHIAREEHHERIYILEAVCEIFFEDFSVQDACSDRGQLKSIVIKWRLLIDIDINSRYIMQKIADHPQISKSNMKNHLYELDYIVTDFWISYK